MAVIVLLLVAASIGSSLGQSVTFDRLPSYDIGWDSAANCEFILYSVYAHSFDMICSI